MADYHRKHSERRCARGKENRPHTAFPRKFSGFFDREPLLESEVFGMFEEYYSVAHYYAHEADKSKHGSKAEIKTENP